MDKSRIAMQSFKEKLAIELIKKVISLWIYMDRFSTRKLSFLTKADSLTLTLHVKNLFRIGKMMVYGASINYGTDRGGRDSTVTKTFKQEMLG